MSIHFCYLKVPDTLIIRPHSLHDALPIYQGHVLGAQRVFLSAIQSLDKGPVLKRNAGRRCSRAVTQQLDQAVRLREFVAYSAVLVYRAGQLLQTKNCGLREDGSVHGKSSQSTLTIRVLLAYVPLSIESG